MTRIILNEVSIELPVFSVSQRSMRRAILAKTGGRIVHGEGPTTVVALDDVSLDLRRGDRVALIGGNGAGKTTLLRVLAGIYEPVRGEVRIEGRVSSLLDITLGGEPDATGYENIRIRAAHLGIGRADITSRIKDVEDFSQLGEYLHLPVRTYSAGMSMRLALAVSTCFEPEILLLDEWISAGEAVFLERANRRMHTFVERSSLLVLASHSIELVRSWCNKAVLLDGGRIIASGGVEEIIKRYKQISVD